MGEKQRRPSEARRPKRTQSNAYLLQARGKGSFRARYLEAIGKGLNKKDAAAAAGCDPSTVREWERLAAEDFAAGRDTPFTRFDISVRKTKVGLVAACFGTINAAIEDGNWRAARWVLERNGYRLPKRADRSVELETGFYSMDDQDRQACEGVRRSPLTRTAVMSRSIGRGEGPA